MPMQRREAEPAEGVAAGRVRVEAEAARADCCRLPEQVQHERHRDQVEEDAEELVE